MSNQKYELKSIPLNELHLGVHRGVMFIYINEENLTAETECYFPSGCSYGAAYGETVEEFYKEVKYQIDFTLERFPETKYIYIFYATTK